MRMLTSVITLLLLSAATVPASAQSPATTPERTTFGRVFGGLQNAAGASGFQVGGGLAARPFGNDAVEIQTDASYGRLGSPDYGSSGIETSITTFQVTGNVLYNFQLNGRNFTPFAGAGLAYTNARMNIDVNVPGLGQIFDDSIGGSDVSLQFLGGVEIPTSARRSFRGEMRLLMTEGDTTVSLLGGISF